MSMSEVTQKLKQLGLRMKEMDEICDKQPIIAEAGAGMIRLTANGAGMVSEVYVDESLYSEEKAILQGLIMSAVNSLQNKVKELRHERTEELTRMLKQPEPNYSD